MKYISLFTVLILTAPLYAQFTGSDTIPSVQVITIGDIVLPFEHNGNIADANYNGVSGGTYLGKSLIFSAGFALSGKYGDSVFANGVNNSSRVADYVRGRVGADSNDNRAGIYKITKQDTAFGTSWKMYKYAVELGALFYDGNGDGLYNPVDLNSNGQWDANEDRPDFLGDVFTFTVFNDAQIPSRRRYSTVPPLGIEMQQYIYAWHIPSDYYKNLIFINYRMVNKGTAADVIDSAYFSIWSDPDMGMYNNDFVGSDSLREGGYIYEGVADAVWGDQPPALMYRFLQKPYSYIPGVSYTDVNSNGLYDEGTDIALDSVVIHYGQLKGTKTVRGAIYTRMNSVTQTMSSHPTHGDPNTYWEMRNYQIGGRTKTGSPVSVCTWGFGNGASLANCAQINPAYFYSGYPENGTGWLNSSQADQRIIVSAGPFRIEKNKPVDITVAYLVGQGNSAMGSVAAMREVADYAHQIYTSNYANFVTDIKDAEAGLPQRFTLQQNYPNPFNPETNIQYSLTWPGNIKLAVYDILGREVKVLESGYKGAGSYNLKFNASELPSGVYICRLTTEQESAIIKMMYIK
ncbi:MAG: T9SS type A sorting domain-containing protein [Ignavibacteriaceae bacterium]|nr:T9SS type A sorting domain-containing protein [Ignavibacteriaceae bacterium]